MIHWYPPPQKGQPTVKELYLIAGRIRHIRQMCEKSIKHDSPQESEPMTDRHWLAQSVLNILDGNIDTQISQELRGRP